MLPFYGKYLNHERNFSTHIHDILAYFVTSAESWNVSPQTYLPYMAITVRLHLHRTRNKYIASGTILVDE